MIKKLVLDKKQIQHQILPTQCRIVQKEYERKFLLMNCRFGVLVLIKHLLKKLVFGFDY